MAVPDGLQGSIARKTPGDEFAPHGSGQLIQFDFTELSKLSKQMDKIAKQGLPKGGLSRGQLIRIWRAVGQQIGRVAMANAPSSGLTGVSRWTSGTSGKTYSYEGKHGDLKRALAYKVKPFRSGEGVRVIIGSSKDSRDQLVGLVGKFATHNVRPTGGGKGSARVGPVVCV